MLRLPKATAPPAIARKSLLSVAHLYIVTLVFLLLWQLITLNSFVTYVASFLGGKVNNTALTFALMLIATEVFALPFLLRFRLSPLARLCSAACVLLIPMTAMVIASLNQPINLTHIVLSALLMVWSACAFWAMGGVEALTPKLRR